MANLFPQPQFQLFYIYYAEEGSGGGSSGTGSTSTSTKHRLELYVGGNKVPYNMTVYQVTITLSIAHNHLTLACGLIHQRSAVLTASYLTFVFISSKQRKDVRVQALRRRSEPIGHT